MIVPTAAAAAAASRVGADDRVAGCSVPPAVGLQAKWCQG
jgi:hypothetical protein